MEGRVGGGGCDVVDRSNRPWIGRGKKTFQRGVVSLDGVNLSAFEVILRLYSGRMGC